MDPVKGRSVSTMEMEGADLPQPLLEQPQGSPPLSDLTSDLLALVVDGPSLVRDGRSGKTREKGDRQARGHISACPVGFV